MQCVVVEVCVCVCTTRVYIQFTAIRFPSSTSRRSVVKRFQHIFKAAFMSQSRALCFKDGRVPKNALYSLPFALHTDGDPTNSSLKLSLSKESRLSNAPT